MHKISNGNIIAKTGNCVECGEVDVRVRWEIAGGLKKPYFRCMNQIRKTRKKWRNKNRHKDREYSLKSRYNASIKKNKIPNKCEVCGNSKYVICYDHDHKTGEHRGWLCNNCNLALGLVRDNPKILRKLAVYLENRQSI